MNIADYESILNIILYKGRPYANPVICKLGTQVHVDKIGEWFPIGLSCQSGRVEYVKYASNIRGTMPNRRNVGITFFHYVIINFLSLNGYSIGVKIFKSGSMLIIGAKSGEELKHVIDCVLGMMKNGICGDDGKNIDFVEEQDKAEIVNIKPVQMPVPGSWRNVGGE